MKFLVMILLPVFFISCHAVPGEVKNTQEKLMIPAVIISSVDTSLRFRDGISYYRQQPFSGHSVERYENDSVHHDNSWFNGKQEGWQFVYYPDGAVSEKRYYHLGEKDSVHTGWWENGRPRFEYHFQNGVYDGDYKEWYASGQPYKNIHYTRGADDYGKGWRENGKVYMSYITRNGRRYGLINANLCYTLKNENGEFIKSVVDTIATK